MSAFGGKADTPPSAFVALMTQSGHGPKALRCPLMTQSGRLEGADMARSQS
jgi:hypothetical protein